MKTYKSFEIDYRRYCCEFKQYKSIHKNEEYQLSFGLNLITRQKHIILRRLTTSDQQFERILQDLQIYHQLNSFKFINHLIAYSFNVVDISKKNKGKNVYIIYQFEDNNLDNSINGTRKQMNKDESFEIVRHILNKFVQVLHNLESVSEIDLNNISFDSRLISASNLGTCSQQIKISYFPFSIIDISSDFNKIFKKTIFSARDLRQINRKQRQNEFIPEGTLKNKYSRVNASQVIYQSQRETENQANNKQILQKVGLFSLKLLYILCHNEFHQEEFSLYTMNESFNIDFNWAVINSFLQQFKHYHIVAAKIIHFMINCHEERSFQEYKQIINQMRIQLSQHTGIYKNTRQNRNIQQVDKRGQRSSNKSKRPRSKSRISSQHQKDDIMNRLNQLKQNIRQNSHMEEIKYEDGSIYKGQTKNGDRQGLGLYLFPQGEIYGGEWKNDEMTGRGIYYFTKQNQIYEGQVLKGVKSGFGIYHYKNNIMYSGQWVNDQKEGYGELYCESIGQVYKGYFKNNFQEGKGIIEYENGQKFQGIFQGGLKHGQGNIFDRQNRLYIKSRWKIGQIEAYAQIFFVNGDHYIGQIKNQSMHGKGIYKYNNGTVYEGDFLDNEMNGVGVMRYSNGDIYEGYMVGNKLNGQGKYYYKNADLTHQGFWKNDVSQGESQYIYGNILKLTCFMKKGKFTSFNIFQIGQQKI